jgi:hypothetical protein
LKAAVADWLNSRRPSFEAGTLYARPLCTKVKEDRGISNDITGRLLCPIDYDWDDPESAMPPLTFVQLLTDFLLEYVQSCGMLPLSMTSSPVFFFVAYTKAKMEILDLLRLDF